MRTLGIMTAIAAAALATAAVTVVVALTVASHRARGRRQP